jgi:hypothetical protein
MVFFIEPGGGGSKEAEEDNDEDQTEIFPTPVLL